MQIKWNVHLHFVHVHVHVRGHVHVYSGSVYMYVMQDKDIRIIMAYMYEDKARQTICQVQYTCTQCTMYMYIQWNPSYHDALK